MPARVEPARPPFAPDIAEIIEQAMRGKPPLHLFATLARDPRLARKFFAGGLLDKGNLSLRQREVIIDRTTALCRSEYEWGVHVAVYAGKAGLTEEQIRSTATGFCRRCMLVRRGPPADSPMRRAATVLRHRRHTLARIA